VCAGDVLFGGCEGRGGADVDFDVGAGFDAGFGGGPSGGRHVARLERIADVGIEEIEIETEVSDFENDIQKHDVILYIRARCGSRAPPFSLSYASRPTNFPARGHSGWKEH
jgi:hypothetical protein